MGDAERLIRTGADIVARQRRLLARLSAGGSGFAKAEHWLSKFEDIQNAFMAHRTMILREVARRG